MTETALSYCAAQVRRHDPDRFLTALFAPAKEREDLLTLYAFNLEVAKTREVVSEALLGRIRLQWWRETIEGLYAGAEPPAHEAARPLADLIPRRQLTQGHFERLIEAREYDFEDEPPPTLEALEDYAEGTSASLLALALEALGVREDGAVAVGREVGIAWALTGLLRAVPFHAQTRRLCLPRDLMRAAGARPSELFDRGQTAGLDRVVRQIAQRAREHLAAARRYRAALPRAALPAVLLARLADFYLAELRRSGYDPFALDPRSKSPLKPLRLTIAAYLGRY